MNFELIHGLSFLSRELALYNEGHEKVCICTEVFFYQEFSEINSKQNYNYLLHNGDYYLLLRQVITINYSEISSTVPQLQVKLYLYCQTMFANHMFTDFLQNTCFTMAY